MSACGLNCMSMWNDVIWTAIIFAMFTWFQSLFRITGAIMHLSKCTWYKCVYKAVCSFCMCHLQQMRYLTYRDNPNKQIKQITVIISLLIYLLNFGNSSVKFNWIFWAQLAHIHENAQCKRKCTVNVLSLQVSSWNQLKQQTEDARYLDRWEGKLTLQQCLISWEIPYSPKVITQMLMYFNTRAHTFRDFSVSSMRQLLQNCYSVTCTLVL